MGRRSAPDSDQRGLCVSKDGGWGSRVSLNVIGLSQFRISHRRLGRAPGFVSLPHAVADKILDDICLEFLRSREFGIALARITPRELGKSTPIERTCQLRIESEC